MNNKILCIFVVAAAVVAASISAVVVSVKRADLARSQAEIVAGNEEVARLELKAVQKECDMTNAAAVKVENEIKLKQEQQKLLDAETRKTEAETRLEEEERKTAELKAKAAAAERERAEIERETQRLILKTADATNKTLAVSARVEEAKAKSEAAKAEQAKLKNERELAAIKEKELRKLDLEAIEQELLEWKRNLEERERAIAPEKTIADLAWVGDGKDSVLDENGEVVRVEKKPYLAENDPAISRNSRALAREVRLAKEASAARAERARQAIVSALERLYVEALKADRPLDAAYYSKSIRTMYPDWKFTNGVENVRK